MARSCQCKSPQIYMLVLIWTFVLVLFMLPFISSFRNKFSFSSAIPRAVEVDGILTVKYIITRQEVSGKMLTYFDETIPQMEAIRFLNRHLKLINELKAKTHFDLEEIQNLLIIHHKLTEQGGPLTYRKFREVAHRVFDIARDELYDKIYSRFDQHRAAHVNLESWVTGLSVLLRGNMQEKIDFCWKVYDLFGTGYVTRELMFQYMKNSIIKTSAGEDANEVVKDLVDVILKKMDIDRDGKISYDDYKTTVYRNPMLLEALGPALPPRPFALGFLTTFTPKYGKM